MEETKDGLTRRNFLITGSMAAGAIGLAAGFAGSLINPREANAANMQLGTTDFPHVALDVEQIRRYGYYFYFNGGCGLGSARALIQGFLDGCAKAVVDPKGWALVPLNLYAWCGGGGPGGQGALCGAIAGSVGVLTLLNLHGALGASVYEWYAKQTFPSNNLILNGYVPPAAGLAGAAAITPNPIPDTAVLGHAVPDSPLCHISVSKWLAAAHAKLGQQYIDTADSGVSKGVKEDRCAKVTGDTAAYTAQLLNDKLAGINPAAWAKPAAMATCFDCHDKDGTVGLTNKSSQTKMDCVPCHTEPVSGRK